MLAAAGGAEAGGLATFGLVLSRVGTIGAALGTLTNVPNVIRSCTQGRGGCQSAVGSTIRSAALTAVAGSSWPAAAVLAGIGGVINDLNAMANS